MPYSSNKLTTVADCDLVLTTAFKDKADLEFRSLSEERHRSSYSDNSTEIELELQGLEAEIAANTTIIAALPDGPSKVDAIKKLTKLQYKKFLLNSRKESFGIVALLQKELVLAQIGLQLTEVDSFISQTNIRKAAL